MALPIESGNFLDMTSVDTIFVQQATTKVNPIEKPHVLESLRPGLMRSSIIEELKKYIVTPGFKEQSQVHLIHAPKKTTYIITECIEINVTIKSEYLLHSGSHTK
jgi:hypothetical protein